MGRNRDFGRRVKARREQLGVKRKRLAEWTGIDPGRVELIELGRLDEGDLTSYEQARLAEVLQCSLDWLIGRLSVAPLLGVGVEASRRQRKEPYQSEMTLDGQRCPDCQRPVIGARCDWCGCPNV